MESAALPLLFEPIFQERVWGGRGLESAFGKELPAGKKIGESWEIVDRPEAQSIVRQGPWRGRTLHELWCKKHDEIFGAEVVAAPRFPILAKLLDAQATLSLQVHPQTKIAATLGGEPKTEMWYIAATEPGAELFVGLRRGTTRARFEEALASGQVVGLLHRLPVRADDIVFVPSGRLHAIGGGNLIVEIQQNSDTTYRVFDWDRASSDAPPRALHIAEAMQSIDFNDFEPGLVRPEGETLLQTPEFGVARWTLTAPRQALERPAAAIFYCLNGAVEMTGVEIKAGEFFLVPASARDATLQPLAPATNLLRIALPTR